MTDTPATDIPRGLYLAFAPLQGHTDAVYRQAHHQAAGGVTEYYTPFVRWEKGGIRNKDLRDITPAANAATPTVPQVIARDHEEFARLCDAVCQLGWRRIDLNMGCPFPMQTHSGRGSGLLPHPDIIADILEEMGRRPEVTFSIKMRIGLHSADECIELLPLLNTASLAHITLHPRLGSQQYKGKPDRTAFARFYEACRQPIVYNGDLTSKEQAGLLLQQFPRLKGVMVGRGLLSQPWLFSDEEPLTVTSRLHHTVFDHALRTLQGDHQILSRMQAFWQYPPPFLDKKSYKKIMKSNTLQQYREVVTSLRLSVCRDDIVPPTETKRPSNTMPDKSPFAHKKPDTWK